MPYGCELAAHYGVASFRKARQNSAISGQETSIQSGCSGQNHALVEFDFQDGIGYVFMERASFFFNRKVCCSGL
jgi:hypothetical protein